MAASVSSMITFASEVTFPAVSVPGRAISFSTFLTFYINFPRSGHSLHENDVSAYSNHLLYPRFFIVVFLSANWIDARWSGGGGRNEIPFNIKLLWDVDLSPLPASSPSHYPRSFPKRFYLKMTFRQGRHVPCLAGEILLPFGSPKNELKNNGAPALFIDFASLPAESRRDHNSLWKMRTERR